MCKCLYCYRPLRDGQKDFHPSCAKKLFGSATAPSLPYSRADIDDLAREVIQSQTTVTGVQAKLSLDINKGGKNEPDRLTLVGLWGRYILKPKSDIYPWLPEDEDLTMHLATMWCLIPSFALMMANWHISPKELTAAMTAPSISWKTLAK